MADHGHPLSFQFWVIITLLEISSWKNKALKEETCITFIFLVPDIFVALHRICSLKSRRENDVFFMHIFFHQPCKPTLCMFIYKRGGPLSLLNYDISTSKMSQLWRRNVKNEQWIEYWEDKMSQLWSRLYWHRIRINKMNKILRKTKKGGGKEGRI